MKQSIIILLTILHFCSLSFAEEPTQKSPRLVVHLLDYLAKDYGGAVANGKVTSTSEYSEQKEFAHSALEMAKSLPETKNETAIISEIAELNKLILSKADATQVAEKALAIKYKVIDVAHIVQTPTVWPNVNHGRELFQRNCVSCHGDNGRGDGPAGKSLDPKPANFLDEENANGMPPFRAFNSIRVGIPGTGMAAWTTFADQDVWDLAFYVSSLHLADKKAKASLSPADLTLAATKSDAELMQTLSGSDEEKKDKIVALRTYSGGGDGSAGGSSAGTATAGVEPNSLNISRKYLAASEVAYAKKDFDQAKHLALLAYLEGIEPVEPRLRANDPEFVSQLETKMAAVRSSIEAKSPPAEVKSRIEEALKIIDDAYKRLTSEAPSPWVAFILTIGIILREGFEAVLILIALLAVIRASGSKEAARWIHGGWVAALVLGVFAWFFSGYLMALSGANREMLEGVTSIIAVIALLYIGFWLHSKTEIGRWTAFIEGSVKNALQGGNLWGLAAISFMAVFREAFETVLFMRAITLEGGSAATTAMATGVVLSLAVLMGLSWAILKYSAKLPIRKIFSISSALMAVLAVILTGKGLHALQETGMLSVTPAWWNYRIDLFGIYPTMQTILPQVGIAAFIYGLWYLGSRTSISTVKVKNNK